MKPIPFEGQNIVVAKDQPQYLPMPAHIGERLTCCWGLTWRERLVVLFTGKIWHQVNIFYGRLQPQKLSTFKPSLK